MSDLFPPFEPERVESKRARFKPIPFRLIAPNVITLLALCLGLTAMRLVVEGKLETATVCILIAAALDGVDGRLARMLKGTSRFGAELDSLSDFVNFGVATGYVLWIFVLHDLKSFGWIIVLTLACAMALQPGAVQRHDRRSQSARMAEELLRRHAGPGRRDHRDAAALPAFHRRAGAGLRRSCFGRASTSSSSPS